ncbi:MAG: hypothetical protein E6J45_05860 [Chloroflexi bacterium]|nr:MAG: hypothetical protein E6J45_05860 [Chloroflexota bacterium]
MGLGVGIFLIAVGAVLAFAIHYSTAGGVDLHTVGWILMAVGGLGTLLRGAARATSAAASRVA